MPLAARVSQGIHCERLVTLSFVKGLRLGSGFVVIASFQNILNVVL
jgi:hypothetical protein